MARGMHFPPEVEAFQWAARFETGIARVDDEHRCLVGHINTLGDALSRRGDFSASELERLYQDLAAYAVKHFKDEEDLMRSAGLDPRARDSHQAQHARFVRDLAVIHGVALEAKAGEDGSARAMMSFLVNWLAFHILGTDQQMAKQIAMLEQGLDGAAAYARVDHGDEQPASRLILDSIDELLGILVVRNHELAAANASLERRVKTLQGVLPICMHCHKIRNDLESWEKLEQYIQAHSGAEFSHGICPACYDAHHS